MISNIDISVCIPVYNAQNTLKQAVWSVLNQSFENFELLLYLDGCNDESEKIIDSFSDKRIKKIVSATNNGIVYARNQLVKTAKGKYIAWLDADDIALPERLKEQFLFLEDHTGVAAVASWVEVRGHKKLKKVKWTGDDDLLNAWILFRNPLVQSSIMIRNRKDWLVYDTNFEYLEDYELLSRLWRQGHRVAIKKDFLSSYFHPNEGELINKYLKYDFVGKLEKIMKLNFELIGYRFESFELALFRDFLRNNYALKPKDAKQVIATLKEISHCIKKSNLRNKNSYLLLIHFQKLRIFNKCPQMKAKIILAALFKPYATLSAFWSRPRYLNSGKS